MSKVNEKYKVDEKTGQVKLKGKGYKNSRFERMMAALKKKQEEDESLQINTA